MQEEEEEADLRPVYFAVCLATLSTPKRVESILKYHVSLFSHSHLSYKLMSERHLFLSLCSSSIMHGKLSVMWHESGDAAYECMKERKV